MSIFLKVILMFLLSLSIAGCSLKKEALPSAIPVFSGGSQNVGGVDGGGGKSIVCRDSSNNILSAELLDLFEGRTMYGLNIIKSNDAMDVQINKAIKFIFKNGYVSTYVHIVKKNMTFLPAGTELKDVDDSFDVVFPSGCKAEQLAHYYSDDKILVNSDIWQHLTETDRAALILHEAIYRLNRSVGAADSRQSRHVVMSLFDSSTGFADPDENIPADALTCISMQGGLYMSVFKNAAGNIWNLQFKALGKNFIFSKKIVQLINFQQKFDFNEAKTFPVFEGTDHIGEEVLSSTTMYSDFEGSDIVMIKRKWEAVGSGYQTPRYYLNWSSGTFSNLTVRNQLLNCAVKINK